MKMTRIAAGLVLLPLCMSASATNQDLTGSFTTIKNVTIAEVTPVVMNGLYLNGGSCTMVTPTLTTNFPGETVMKLSAATSGLGPTADLGATAASATCGGVAGTTGVYEIDGASGADVFITLTSGTTAGITFAPVGCAGDYDGASNGDLCTAIPNGAATSIQLASTADQTVSAGNGVPVAGKSYLALAGTVSSVLGLSAATAYPVDFDISVTYQ